MDGDVEHNGQVSYSLPSDSIFVVNSLSGEIRSKEPLDYEKDRVGIMLYLHFLMDYNDSIILI